MSETPRSGGVLGYFEILVDPEGHLVHGGDKKHLERVLEEPPKEVEESNHGE